MFLSSHAPNIHGNQRLRAMMRQVIYATIPGIAVIAYFFGPGVIINALLAMLTAVLCEALILKVRKRDWQSEIADSSALVTGILLGIALPPLVPFWVTIIGVSFAIIFAKHLFGGLGYNPFNPAMAGYVLLLISFPVQMTAWSPVSSLWAGELSFADSAGLIFLGQTSNGIALEQLLAGFDGFSSATPLDSMKNQLEQGLMSSEIIAQPLYNGIAGLGWMWVNLAFLAGGIYLAVRKILAWQLAVSMLLGLASFALIAELFSPSQHPGMIFHLLSGATMFGAFFIVTDPVSAATTPKGRWIFGFGVGALTWLIRTYGGYPDALAFAVLLMNMCAPMIDYYTKPISYGAKP
jgi:Na+-translocating ferredoxin:NAD+ oxidoreductase subunit D